MHCQTKPGPADIGFSFGLHLAQDYDLPAMMASPDMQHIYSNVLRVSDRSDWVGWSVWGPGFVYVVIYVLL